jgi:hypothetical protein
MFLRKNLLSVYIEKANTKVRREKYFLIILFCVFLICVEIELDKICDEKI